MNPAVKFYMNLVERGLKSIEDISPLLLQQQVQEALNEKNGGESNE